MARKTLNQPHTLNSMQAREAKQRYDRNEATVEELAFDYDVDEDLIRRVCEGELRGSLSKPFEPVA